MKTINIFLQDDLTINILPENLNEEDFENFLSEVEEPKVAETTQVKAAVKAEAPKTAAKPQAEAK